MTYEYICVTCTAKNNKETFFYLVADKPPKPHPNCPICGSEKVMRAWNAPTVIFKGKGFYSSDNKDKENERT